MTEQAPDIIIQTKDANLAIELLNQHRTSDDSVGAALACVSLHADRLDHERAIRDSLIRIAHQQGASYRQIAHSARLDQRTVATIAKVG